MFGLLKKALESFTKKAEAEVEKTEDAAKDSAKTDKKKEAAETKQEKKGFLSKIFAGKAEAEKSPEITEAKSETKKPKELVKIEEKVGFIESITKVITETKLSSERFDKIFAGLEVGLLENNVSAEIAEKIKEKLKSDLVGTSINRGHVGEIIKDDLKDVLFLILNEPKKISLLDTVHTISETGRPAVVLFVGANGHGKTTTIAKVANYLKQNNISCVFAASDTFRAASIEQLEEHAKKLGVRVVKQQYGSDPAAVAFDAIKHATANKINCVLIDSAGRQHTNANLMDELKKLKRVAKPDITIFIGESIAGHDVVDQIKDYDAAVNIDGIIMTKVDVDEKGGAIMSAVHAIGKPVLFLGVGQEYKDLKEFNPEEFISKII
ncbi:MAG: signal recognition particle-docking protein FtsY [DPANN group archaeon]|nr:signal recognition particle-docking protein FtsY [DPANN group archaeon]